MQVSALIAEGTAPLLEEATGLWRRRHGERVTVEAECSAVAGPPGHVEVLTHLAYAAALLWSLRTASRASVY